MLILLSGCSDDNTDKQETSIIGTWQLIRRTANNIDGSSNNWENIDNGHNIIFRENLNYESNEFTACENNVNQGIFKLNQASNDNITKDIVEVTINNCQNKSSGIFVRLFYYSFNKNDLILVPKEPSCFEGCAFLYKKIHKQNINKNTYIMKTIILIFSTLTILLSCGNDNEDIITENATIFYHFPPGFEPATCGYLIETEDNIYAPENLNEKFREHKLRVKISYIKTEEKLDCSIFSEPYPKIEIVSIQKL